MANTHNTTRNAAHTQEHHMQTQFAYLCDHNDLLNWGPCLCDGLLGVKHPPVTPPTASSITRCGSLCVHGGVCESVREIET